jgi:hypothetical protein
LIFFFLSFPLIISFILLFLLPTSDHCYMKTVNKVVSLSFRWDCSKHELLCMYMRTVCFIIGLAYTHRQHNSHRSSPEYRCVYIYAYYYYKQLFLQSIYFICQEVAGE